MKRALLLVVLGAAIGGGVVWFLKRPAAAPSAEAKPAEEEAGPKVTRDANGNAVITMTDEIQGNMGLQVTNPAPMRMSPEIKGYGRVLDPASLAALMNEFTSALAAAAVSSNELARLQTLSGQGNASARAVETAEAAARRDQLTVQSARDRLALSWGKALSERSDLPAYVQSLTALQRVLLRVDLPIGETIETPTGARILTLAGQSLEAALLGPAPSVDPQMQGRGFLLEVSSNTAHLLPGEAVSVSLKVPGEPLTGVVVPRDAVIRAEGAAWVYVLDKEGAEAFTRRELTLDEPTDAGWFVTKGLSTGDYIVVRGAQQLLSIELKGQGGE